MKYGPGFDRPGETRSGQKISYPVNKDVLPGAETSFASIGERWANVANTPYQYAKEQSYEGGIRTPMIVYWPKGLKRTGVLTNHLGHVMDFMPTFLEVANATYPTTFHAHTITPTTGVSFLPVLKGEKERVHHTLFNEHFKARYVRDEEWKMVSLSGDTTWHLYKINQDQTELNDLAAQYPDVVNKLSNEWRHWANTHQVFPKPD